MRLESGFAWCEGDIVPTLIMSTGVLLFLVVVVGFVVVVVVFVVDEHVDGESNQYGSRGEGYFLGGLGWRLRKRGELGI